MLMLVFPWHLETSVFSVEFTEPATFQRDRFEAQFRFVRDCVAQVNAEKSIAGNTFFRGGRNPNCKNRKCESLYYSNFQSKRLFQNMSPDIRERSRTEDDSDSWEGILKVLELTTINIHKLESCQGVLHLPGGSHLPHLHLVLP